MASFKITEKYLEFDHKKYFRANAHEVELCTHGEMKKPILGTNYLAPEGKIARRHLEKRPINMTGPHDVNWSSISKGDLEAGADLNFFGLGRNHALKFDLGRAKKSNLKLVKFSIKEGPLKRCLNQDARTVRNAMADEGKDARIVSGIWVVFDAELAEHFGAHFGTSHSVEAFGSELGITVSGGTRGEATVKLSDSSTFAYQLYKVKKWSKGKAQIEDMEDDFFGLG